MVESTRQLVRDDSWDYRLGPQFLSLNENVDGQSPHIGWLSELFDATTWSVAIIATPKRIMSPMVVPWRLVPRDIPHLTEIPTLFDSVVKCSDGACAESWKRMTAGKSTVTVLPGTVQWAEIESKHLTTGFLDLALQVDELTPASPRPKISILYSECYEYPMQEGKGPPKRVKGDRTDSGEGHLFGISDTYKARAGAQQYSPFWFRTFRFVRVTIDATGCQGSTRLTSLGYRETHYPLVVRTSISTPNPLLRSLWDISVRTLRNCMHETYEDCPFYEQNQFAMDTRSMILFTYLLAGDDRLARKAIQEFYASRREDGLVETHYPSPGRSTNIPTFSLFWVLMVCDHMVFFADEALVRKYIGAVDDVLNYFHQRINSTTGLVGQFDADCWAFVDWADGWASPEKGFFGLAVPPAYYKTGSATYHSLVYAYTLAQASELCLFLGRKDTAQEYLGRRDSLLSAVKAHCFDATRGLFLDGPHDQGRPSQHVQIFAVLTGCVKGEEAKRLLRRSILQREELGLVKASLAMGFYTFRAASAAGVYEECWETLIEPWKKMIDAKLTTWAESETMMRSDCHGWSSTPVWEIATELLGVQFQNSRYLGRVGKDRTGREQQLYQDTSVTFAPKPGLLSEDISADVLVSPGETENIARVDITMRAAGPQVSISKRSHET